MENGGARLFFCSQPLTFLHMLHPKKKTLSFRQPCVAEHVVVESRPDNKVADLR
jgi:hypothetical protein